MRSEYKKKFKALYSDKIFFYTHKQARSKDWEQKNGREDMKQICISKMEHDVFKISAISCTAT